MAFHHTLRKRNRTSGSPESPADPDPALGCKRRDLSPLDLPRHPQQLSHFWDDLTEIRLTRGALKEFDDRIHRQRPRPAIPSRPWKRLHDPPALAVLKRFARLGGADLCHLRGFATSSISSRSCHSRKRSSILDSGGRKAKTGVSYSQYKGKIIQAGIYPEGHIYPNTEPHPPKNLDDTLERLGHARPSLSPSRFTEENFRDFKGDVKRVDGEDQSLARAMATIEGRHHHFSMSKYPFNHVKQFRKDIADAVPDLYDGAVLEAIHSKIRCDLDETIIPCNETSRLAVPNFFLEAKRADASPHVAKLQACHNGAIGARGMNDIQNYGRDNPQYDGNAYTFTNTYHNSGAVLQMYATHPTASRTSGGDPEYHMTQLQGYCMTGNSRIFREGATTYRNARDLAAEHRNTFIQQANRVAQSIPADTPSGGFVVSHTSRSTQLESESNTFIDELVHDYLANTKR